MTSLVILNGPKEHRNVVAQREKRTWGDSGTFLPILQIVMNPYTRGVTLVRCRAAVLVLVVWSGAVAAQSTPVGLWRTVDDANGKAKALVRIVETAGALSGRIEHLFDPDPNWNGRCDRCRDDRKDQPVLGMTIIEGVKKNADEAWWDGGTILDPNNGKTYRTRLKPVDGGKKLEMRGYIGPFYRTQTWIRVE